ncbi:MAG: WhiB family transcriptional regulator [Porticoccaceae bacterium]
MDRAACSDAPHGMFFPVERSASRQLIAEDRARRICAKCPVKVQCLDYAMIHNESGMWGGTTEDERHLRRGEWWSSRGASQTLAAIQAASVIDGES